MARAELGVSKRELTPRPHSLVENLHVTGTGHWLERHRAFVVSDAEHVAAEFLPMTALYPKVSRQELGRLDLGVTKLAHLAANVFF